jgi:sirohydrochlorin ferrochelatase
MTSMPPLVAVAHGSADPRSAATVSELLDLVRSRAPGLDVRAAFLGHAAPSVPAVLGGLSGPAVVLPLLLTPAYHSKLDLPGQLRGYSRVLYGSTLGPHPLLIDAAERRLGTAPDPGTAVVLAAAGSSDPGANAAIRGMAAMWQAVRRQDAGGWHSVAPAYACAPPTHPALSHTVDEAVRSLRAAPGVRRVVVSTYLLAPGFFADRIRTSAQAAGADLVSSALGALPEIADLILERYTVTAGDICLRSA